MEPSPTRRCVAGLVQMTAVNDVGANFAACSKLVEEACAKSAQIVFFPECFSFIGAAAGEAQAVAEPLSGPILARYRELAKQHSVWLSLGGFQERVDGEERIYNTHVVIDGGGEIRATYRKIHLFDVPMVNLVESRQALAGSELVAVDSPAGRLGLTVCYDLRFPELFQKLTFVHGARVLLVPSAFAVKTGEAHWETLLRARAIETQCYVVAAAQAGQHNTGRQLPRVVGPRARLRPVGQVRRQARRSGRHGRRDLRDRRRPHRRDAQQHADAPAPPLRPVRRRAARRGAGGRGVAKGRRLDVLWLVIFWSQSTNP